MIDLTPLDVRKKRGDFAKGLRGYDTQEVDVFLELVAERMEALVKENLTLRARTDRLEERVVTQEGKEKAVQEALVTAQELRQDVKTQARREAKLMEREARGRIEGMIVEGKKLLKERRAAIRELERQRDRFLKTFRTFLERELDTVEVEFGRAPLEDDTLDLDLGRGNWSIGEDEDEDEDDDQDGAGHRNEQDEEQAEDHPPEAEGEGEDVSAPDSGETAEAALAADPPPAAGSDAREAEGGEEGEGSQWLSSIVVDREDEGAE